jgi:TonB-linked SusC/RagA family outer membrane protein
MTPPLQQKPFWYAIERFANRCRITACITAMVAVHSFALQAQNFSVTGKISSSDDGLPLAGVTVIEKGTTNGTSTDTDGLFKIQVSNDKAVLVFSFIGYTQQEVAVNAQSEINLSMDPDIQQLSEIVVVGYGSVKKTDLTGAVGLMDNEQLTKRSTVGVLEAMQGQVAGVDISSTNGRAGGGFNIQIRGVQSVEGGKPLYVVDGVIVPDGIDFLNPQDIERIDVLKDASSTAIYGSRGAYGVVIVTTKSGTTQKQKAVISYDGYVGVRNVARMPQFMDGTKWWNWRQDSFISDAIVKNQAIPVNPGYNTTSPELQRRIDENDYTDWQDLVTQNGKQQNHWVSLAGRGDKMGYIFGFGYQDEGGNVIGEEYKRYNFKASIDHTLNDKWSGGMNMNISFAEHNQGSPNVMVEGFRMAPLLSPYNTETGSLILQPGKDEIDGITPIAYHIDFTSSVNPLIEVKKAWVDKNTTYAIGNVYLQFSPIKALSVKTTFAPRFTFSRQGQFTGTGAEGNLTTPPQGRVDNNSSFSYVWDNQINYSKSFGSHSFNVMGLASVNSFIDESNFLRQTKMDANAPNYYATGRGGDPTTVTAGGSWSKETLMSYALRVNYSFQDKYLLTLSNRADGSSKLAPGKQWEMFPSAGVAWKVSDESFMSSLTVVNQLKARVSFGYTGNNPVSRYNSTRTASTVTYYDYDNVASLGAAPDRIANPDLTWERTEEIDFGLDFGLYKSRITGSIDYYNKKSSNLILTRLLPAESGFPSISQNVGEVVNKGIEVSLTTVNVSTDKLTWNTTFNFARNKNEVTALYGDSDKIGLVVNDGYAADDWAIIGESLGSYFNWVADGVWQNGDTDAALYNQLEGQGRVIDFDGNQVINDLDKRIVGSNLPKWTGGFNTTLTYGNFDFALSMITRQGVTAFSPFHQEFASHEDRGRAKLDIDWYMQDNPITETRITNFYPQPKNAGVYWRQYNVGYYRDASFVKVKNITLGYTIPGSVLDRLKLTNVRVYTSVINPFVFSDYDGFDPEWATSTFAQGGVSSTTYMFGLNLKF